MNSNGAANLWRKAAVLEDAVGGQLIPHVNDVPFVRKPPLAFWP